MGPAAIMLHVAHGDREGTYRFTCPECLDAVEKRADRKIIALLVSAGVDIAGPGTDLLQQDDREPWFAETEPDPRGDLPSWPAFTVDDVIDFHFLLEDDRYIEDFLAGQR